MEFSYKRIFLIFRKKEVGKNRILSHCRKLPKIHLISIFCCSSFPSSSSRYFCAIKKIKKSFMECIFYFILFVVCWLINFNFNWSNILFLLCFYHIHALNEYVTSICFSITGLLELIHGLLGSIQITNKHDEHV